MSQKQNKKTIVFMSVYVCVCLPEWACFLRVHVCVSMSRCKEYKAPLKVLYKQYKLLHYKKYKMLHLTGAQSACLFLCVCVCVWACICCIRYLPCISYDQEYKTLAPDVSLKGLCVSDCQYVCVCVWAFFFFSLRFCAGLVKEYKVLSNV